MSEHRRNREQMNRRQIERLLKDGDSISAAAKKVGCSYKYAKLVAGQMESKE